MLSEPIHLRLLIAILVALSLCALPALWRARPRRPHAVRLDRAFILPAGIFIALLTAWAFAVHLEQ